MKLFACLALLVAFMPESSAEATTLNLSHDLVPLGIAATNMTPNQPALDAGPLFMQGVAYAKSHGIATVVADPGAYYFLSVVDNTHVAVAGIDNMTIDFQGAELIFSRPLYYGLIVYSSTNATLQNFTVDYQPLPFTQVRVASVDIPNAQIQYLVEPGWQNPSAFNAVQPMPGAGPPSMQVHMFRSGQPVLARLFTQRPFSGDHFAVVNTAPATLQAVRVGDVAVLLMRGGADAINTNHCTGCTLRNITVFSCGCGGSAVQASPAESVVMERIYAIPKPGTDRLVSAISAAVIGLAGPNNQIRLSRGIRTTDDAFWFYGRVVGTVQNQPGSRIVTAEAGSGFTALGYGDTIPNGSPVNFQRHSDGVILASAIVVSQGAASGQPPRVTYTVDRDLPGNLLGTVMYTTDANINGANSILERSTSQSQSCCKGTYFAGAANSTARGNYLRHSAFAGVFLVQGMTPGDPPTPPLVNFSVTRNVIDGTNKVSDWWWFELGSIQTVTLHSGYDLMSTSPFSNITVTNNFIADSGRSAAWIGNTAGGSVSGNYVFHPNVRPDVANANPAKLADALLPLVIDTTSSGIAANNNVVDSSSGRMLITDTQYRELAAYAPGSTIRLNAYGLGALAAATVTLTDADGATSPAAVQSAGAHRLDVQLPAAPALGGAFLTLSLGGAKYFGTLFVDSQDNVPAVNGCTYEPSVSSTSVPAAASSVAILVVTQAGCPYQVLAADPFVTPGSGGTGTAVISVGFGANGGPPRSTTIEIAAHPITLMQSGIADGSSFTDADLTGVSVKAVHVSELRTRINASRANRGLAAFAWTDPSLGQGSTPVRALHIQELRAALNEAYARSGRAVPQYTDAIAAGVTTIKAAHITELRSAVVAMEQP
jgi:hypothetical protein